MISERLKAFIAYLGITDAEFADKCKISRATLSLFLSGKNKKINDVIISSIHNAYPKLSMSWLLFNEGEMISLDENNANSLSEKCISQEQAVDKQQNLDKDQNTKIYLDIDCLKEKKSKEIAQITVYYDDSSFQVFYPQRPNSQTPNLKNR